jgi:hypothetical protein
MATKLEKPLKREISVGGEAYIVTLTPAELLITLKGHRKGKLLAWKDLIGDDAALATALNASLGLFEKQRATSATASSTRKRAKRKS